jgi:hypothetical protein
MRRDETRREMKDKIDIMISGGVKWSLPLYEVEETRTF